MTKKLILHIPHAGTDIPDKTGYVVSDAVLNDEILLLTDWFTDDLFSTSDCVPVVANFNRVFCDVERFADDDKEVMAAVGMGVTYKKCDDGSDLRNVSDELKAYILNKYYQPHHQKLSAAVAEQLISNGSALIVDCHSFSNRPFQRDLSQETTRPDICIGTDSFHTPTGLIEFSWDFFNGNDFSVEVNQPYSGTMVPLEHYQQDSRVSSIMIEINRNLYLDTGSNKKNEHYDKIKLIIQDYLAKLSNNF
jgi:N-formylglutamate deformylase